MEIAVQDILDNFDRPGRVDVDGLYYEIYMQKYSFENKPGKRVPKFGVGSKVGMGRVKAAWRVCSAEANGPNSSFKVETNIRESKMMARAEVASVAASVGPLKVKAALAVDTGIIMKEDQFELKALGTGLTLGRNLGVSFLGNELKINLW